MSTQVNDTSKFSDIYGRRVEPPIFQVVAANGERLEVSRMQIYRWAVIVPATLSWWFGI